MRYGIRLSTNTNVNTNTKIATPAQTCSTIIIIIGIKQVLTVQSSVVLVTGLGREVDPC